MDFFSKIMNEHACLFRLSSDILRRPHKFAQSSTYNLTLLSNVKCRDSGRWPNLCGLLRISEHHIFILHNPSHATTERGQERPQRPLQRPASLFLSRKSENWRLLHRAPRTLDTYACHTGGPVRGRSICITQYFFTIDCRVKILQYNLFQRKEIESFLFLVKLLWVSISTATGHTGWQWGRRKL